MDLARCASLVLLSLAAHCVQMSRAEAQAASTSASPLGPLSMARLIAADAVGSAGRWRAGVEVTLAPSVITYWRNPGEAGVPPTFDFSRSDNVAKVEVLYPAPRRIHEGDLDAIGYVDQVVFPLHVTAVAPDKPVRLALAFDYATCGKICLPAHADLMLDLPPAAADLDAAAISAAEAQTPKILGAAEAARAVAVAPAGEGGKASWTIAPKAGLGVTDLFVEAPEGFYVSAVREGDGFRATVDEHPHDTPAPPSLRLTLLSEKGAIDLTTPLPR